LARKHRARLGAALLGATAALTLSAPAAGAAEIPRGDYVCSTTSGYAGTVNIKKKNKYSINDGKKGKYSYSKKHKTLNFKTGDYKGFFGSFIKPDKTIEIFDSKSGDYLWSCNR
jgi:hypothetical protein